MRYFSLVLILGFLLFVGSVIAQDSTPSPTASPEPPTNLRIWWPDTLALSGDNAIHSILLEQSQAFLNSQTNVVMEHRLKAVGTIGGIMSTLRTSRNVAPDALPSLTLMRRQDLVLAQREGLLQSLEGGVSSTIQGDLRNVLHLGQINGELYGLPYSLELQHLVYHPQSELDYSQWNYTAILERNVPFIFAAGRVGGLSDVFLMQYLSSGGTVNPDGSLALNQVALEKTLNFYEAASDAEILNGFSLNYNSTGAYLTEFQNGNYEMAVFNSTTYLQLYAEDNELAIAPIPTETGTASTILNGWVWVLITEDAKEKAVALDYLNWIMDSNRQAEFSQASFIIPSRQSAIMQGLAGDAPIEPFMEMLQNTVLPLSDSETGGLGNTMQSALASVLTLENTAAEAAAQVINQQAP